ncbi:uncharacterized protein RCO7_10238 [Rhynchosporium graminicola]|uniref:Uncharacterized protein n=1 Tax=Rhynchosporium graminicola TaxID=2792576 RepID=A0A1E1LD03_9HELO|nr:uncharacterized protein RCO7_10238 [Rhynchosporium commune]
MSMRAFHGAKHLILQDLLRAGPSQAPGSRDLASRSYYE